MQTKLGIRPSTSKEKRRQRFITSQARKVNRVNFWRPIIARELRYILTIIWYIKVDLIRTQQLPTYMTFTQIDRVPALKENIESQASKVFRSLFRDEDKFSMFRLADTDIASDNGNIGTVTSYDFINSRFNTRTCPRNIWDSNAAVYQSHATEHMEPLHRCNPNKMSSTTSCTDVIEVTIQNHFPDHKQAMVPTRFRVAQFNELLRYNAYPERGRPCCRAKLVSLINDIETKEMEEAHKVEAERVELQKGLARLHSVRTAVSQRPRKKVRNGGKPPCPKRMTQLKSVWKAKIEHYLSRECPNNGDDSDHLFTFPFVTSDNSLHTCSQGLTELGGLGHQELVHDVMYGKKNLAESTVINAASLSSLAPGNNIDAPVFDFCLTW